MKLLIVHNIKLYIIKEINFILIILTLHYYYWNIYNMYNINYQ